MKNIFIFKVTTIWQQLLKVINDDGGHIETWRQKKIKQNLIIFYTRCQLTNNLLAGNHFYPLFYMSPLNWFSPLQRLNMRAGLNSIKKYLENLIATFNLCHLTIAIAYASDREFNVLIIYFEIFYCHSLNWRFIWWSLLN